MKLTASVKFFDSECLTYTNQVFSISCSFVTASLRPRLAPHAFVFCPLLPPLPLFLCEIFNILFPCLPHLCFPILFLYTFSVVEPPAYRLVCVYFLVLRNFLLDSRLLNSKLILFMSILNTCVANLDFAAKLVPSFTSSSSYRRNDFSVFLQLLCLMSFQCTVSTVYRTAFPPPLPYSVYLRVHLYVFLLYTYPLTALISSCYI